MIYKTIRSNISETKQLYHIHNIYIYSIPCLPSLKSPKRWMSTHLRASAKSSSSSSVSTTATSSASASSTSAWYTLIDVKKKNVNIQVEFPCHSANHICTYLYIYIYT